MQHHRPVVDHVHSMVIEIIEMGDSFVVPKELRKLVTSLLLSSRLGEESGMASRPWAREIWLGDTLVSDAWCVRAGG